MTTGASGSTLTQHPGRRPPRWTQDNGDLEPRVTAQPGPGRRGRPRAHCGGKEGSQLPGQWAQWEGGGPHCGEGVRAREGPRPTLGTDRHVDCAGPTALHILPQPPASASQDGPHRRHALGLGKGLWSASPLPPSRKPQMGPLNRRSSCAPHREACRPRCPAASFHARPRHGPTAPPEGCGGCPPASPPERSQSLELLGLGPGARGSRACESTSIPYPMPFWDI